MIGLGIRVWRRVGLGICKVGGFGSVQPHPLDLVFCSENHLECRAPLVNSDLISGGFLHSAALVLCYIHYILDCFILRIYICVKA